MPETIFDQIRTILSEPPWSGILWALQVIAGVAVILSVVGIIVFNRKRKQIEDEFKIKTPGQE